MKTMKTSKKQNRKKVKQAKSKTKFRSEEKHHTCERKQLQTETVKWK